MGPKDLEKFHSLSMLISKLTLVVYTNTNPEVNLVVMQSNSLVGVLMVVLPTGGLPTLGMKIGVKRDSSESSEEKMNVVLSLDISLAISFKYERLIVLKQKLFTS